MQQPKARRKWWNNERPIRGSRRSARPAVAHYGAIAWALFSRSQPRLIGLPSCKSPERSARGQHEGHFHSVLLLQVHVFPPICTLLTECLPAHQ